VTGAPLVAPGAAREAARLRELAVEAKARGELLSARLHLRRALRLLHVRIGRRAGDPAAVADTHPHAALAAGVLISLAHAEAERGRTSLGSALLARAEDLVAPGDHGTLHGQRGLLLLRTGQTRAALAHLDTAAALIDPGRQPVDLARVLLNRAVARLETGAFAAARGDLERCAELARAADQPLLAIKALHNIGCCDLAVGDLPAALSTIGRAAEGFADWPAWRPVAIVDLARALLQAGLAADAAAELDAAIALFRSQRMSQDQAEAEAVRAEASLLAGDADAARDWARHARAGFRRRGNTAAAAAAELIELQAEQRRGALPPRSLARRAFGLAERLEELGLRHYSIAAALLGVRALSAAGACDEAAERAGTLPRPRAATPLTVRMLRHLALAELAEASGERAAALRTLRRGLTELARHRAQLGSIDLQTGTAALGVELSSRGLALSLQEGGPGQIFAWSELSRAQSLRITPVRPPADPELADAVAELRTLEAGRRAAVMSGHPADPAFNSQIAALKRRIRHRSWPVQGGGTVQKTATLAEVAAALGERDQAMLSLFRVGRTLYGLVVAGPRSRVLRLCDADETYEIARRLRADITALVGRLLPSRMEKALAEAINAHAGLLADRLFNAEVAALVGTRELVIVSGDLLAATPWQLVPPLRGRPVSAAPSASSWLAAHRAGAGPGAGRGAARAVLIAGPGLREGERELEAIAAQYSETVVVRGAEATVAATLAALEGAETAHLVVHGDHEPDNPLFSRLELADGPLMAYDLLGLRTPPRHVVLSACEVGRVSTRPGDEPLGVVTTLLHLGSQTVVAAVAPISDGATVEVMAAYHRHVTAGSTPARALAAATASNPLAVFNCYGASP
jgi:tetratricopeptide (TPR) repeat protein